MYRGVVVLNNGLESADGSTFGTVDTFPYTEFTTHFCQSIWLFYVTTITIKLICEDYTFPKLFDLENIIVKTITDILVT